jgi:hypothetical protein
LPFLCMLVTTPGVSKTLGMQERQMVSLLRRWLLCDSPAGEGLRKPI